MLLDAFLAGIEVRDSPFLPNQSGIYGIFMPNTTVALEHCEFDTTVGAAGTFETANIGVHPDVDPGAIDTDRWDLDFDWDRADTFPAPQLITACVPVGEKRTGTGARDHGRCTPPWVG